MRERLKTLREIATCVFLVCELSWEAYRQRLREGRSLFAPTLKARPHALRRAALDGRPLSSEPFLRPTRYADSRAPEIVALADDFRAETGSDWEYASAIFEFVCNHIDVCFDFPPQHGVVGTLERGFGTCIEKLNLLVALARAGGIRARYCTIGIDPAQAGVLALMEDDDGIFGVLNQSSKRFIAEKNDPRAKRIASFNLWCSSRFRKGFKKRVLDGTLDAAQNQWTHFVAELRIGDGWIAADPTVSDEDCAAYKWPLQRFGFEPLILGRFMGLAINGRSEALPFRWRRYIFWIAHLCVSRGFFDHINSFGERQRAVGRDLLEEIGSETMRLKRQHLQRRISPVAERPGLLHAAEH